MNKTELIEQVARKSNLSKAAARRAVDAIFSTVPKEGIIASAVAGGDRVQITGFGTFEQRKRKKRNGRNPLTGDPIVIPAAKYPAFTAGKSLKDRVQK
ncbi:MAG: HU family DNA-binding protein [Candidatus Krumholzibacteriia bacterium]